MIYSVSYFNVVGLGASFGGANWPSRLLSRLNHAPLLWTYCICSCFLVVLLPLHAITRFFSHPSYFFATVSISATAASTLLTSFLTLSTTSCCFPVPPFVSNCISVFFRLFSSHMGSGLSPAMPFLTFTTLIVCSALNCFYSKHSYALLHILQ